MGIPSFFQAVPTYVLLYVVEDGGDNRTNDKARGYFIPPRFFHVFRFLSSNFARLGPGLVVVCMLYIVEGS